MTTDPMRVRARPPKSLLLVSLAWAAISGPALHSAPPDTFELPEPTPTPEPTPEAEGPVDEESAPPTAVEPAESPSTAPQNAEAQTESAAADTVPNSIDVVSAPVVQSLPVAPAQAPSDGNAQPPSVAAPVAPLTAPPSPTTSATQNRDNAVEVDAVDVGGDNATAEIPGLSTTLPEATTTANAGDSPAATISTGETHQAVWWLLGVIGAVLFGFLGWTYTRRRTAPVAAIEKPSIAGASALNSIEDAKLALSLDILGATRSLMMLSVEFRLSVHNRSVRAIRNLAVIPQLDTAQRSNAGELGPAVAQGTGEAIRVDRIGPHQSEVITGTVTLPVSAIRPILQGSKPLFVPLMHFQLQLDRLSPQTHSFVLGLPSAASAARLHPLALDDTPGGIPGLQTRRLEGHTR